MGEKMDILKKKHRGSILVISVIMLGVLGGLSISALSDIAVEHTIVRQDQDQLLAKRAAEFAVSRARQLLLSSWSVGAAKCNSSGCCSGKTVCVWSKNSRFENVDLMKKNETWWGNYSAAVSKPSSRMAADPSYLIIDLGCNNVSGSSVYRIVGRGVGASSNTVAYADTYFNLELSGQNSFTGATTIVVRGKTTAGENWNINLAPLTVVDSSFFRYNTVPGACPQGNNTSALCEMNCEGQVRVKGYSSYEDCKWVYGPWTKGANTQSSIKLTRPKGRMEDYQNWELIPKTCTRQVQDGWDYINCKNVRTCARRVKIGRWSFCWSYKTTQECDKVAHMVDEDYDCSYEGWVTRQRPVYDPQVETVTCERSSALTTPAAGTPPDQIDAPPPPAASPLPTLDWTPPPPPPPPPVCTTTRECTGTNKWGTETGCRDVRRCVPG